jgi:hypothetical protein
MIQRLEVEANAMASTAHLASTGLGTAGAERGHQIRQEFGVLAAAKDQLGEQQPLTSEDVHGVVGKDVDPGHVQERKTLLGT